MHIIEGPNRLDSNRASDKYLEINSCGYSLDEHRDLSIERTDGRLDYQLIYVSSGTIEYRFDGVPTEVSQGDAVIYKPGEPQIYKLWKRLPQATYWVHFSGTMVRELLSALSLDGGYVYRVGVNDELPALFEKIFEELIIRSRGFQDSACAYLIRLLNLVSRLSSRGEAPDMTSDARLRQVVEHLRCHFSDNIDIDMLARMCCLSRSRFVHLFKEVTGDSPYSYVTGLRMEKAKQLLSADSLSVTEIGDAVGYSELKSFIRVFTKEVGIPPGIYRKALRKERGGES